MFVLFQPVWLLLLIPLAAAGFAWSLPGRGLKILRVVVFLLVVLALAQLADRTVLELNPTTSLHSILMLS